MTDAELLEALIEKTADIIPGVPDWLEKPLLRYGFEILLQQVDADLRRVILDAGDGLTEEEISNGISVLASKVNLKAIPDFIEPIIWKTLAEAIYKYARQGMSLSA